MIIKYHTVNRIRSLEEWKKAKKKWGVIYNESGPKHRLNSRSYHPPMLHSTRCGAIQSMHYSTLVGIDKYFFEDYGEASECLKQNREGVKIADCARCEAWLVIKAK